MIALVMVKVDGDQMSVFSNELLQHVSVSRKTRFHGFHRVEDSYRTLLGEILTRYLIMRVLKQPNRKIQFEQLEYGKPVLRGREIHFNVAHSGNWVLCGVDDEEIGVDVERIKPIDFGIARNFFSPQEVCQLGGCNEVERSRKFFELWACKESFIKWTGLGLHQELNSFIVSFVGDSVGLQCDQYKPTPNIRKYSVAEEYTAAVCSRNAGIPQKILEIGTKELCDQFLAAVG